MLNSGSTTTGSNSGSTTTMMGGRRGRKGSRKATRRSASRKGRKGTRRSQRGGQVASTLSVPHRMEAHEGPHNGPHSTLSAPSGAPAAVGARPMMGGAKKALGSKAQVWHGTAHHTSGGLTKKDLMKHKGRIVSKKKHALGKKAFKKLVAAGYKPKKGTFKLFRK